MLAFDAGRLKLSSFSRTAIGHRRLPSSSSTAALKKAHFEYHEDTLVARAQVLATRRLLLKPTEDEQLLARVMKKEAHLAQNKPDRIKCRQAYLAALAPHAGGKRRCHPRVPTPRTVARARGLGEGGESVGVLSEGERKRCT